MRVFRVADHEYDVVFSTFKMADGFYKNWSNLPEFIYSGSFRVADYESNVGFSKFKTVDSIWQNAILKIDPI